MTAQVGDVLRIVCKMSWGADDIQNVYHGQVSGTSIPENGVMLAAIASQLDTAYDLIDLAIPDAISFDTIEIYNVTQDEYVGETAWPGLTEGGDDASDPMPPQTCPLILFNTATLGSQGRKFLPPVTEPYNESDGTPSAGWLATLATFAADLLAGVGGLDWDVTLGNYRYTSADFYAWLNAEVKDFWATQRRRYFGRGG